jgi:hypothetical protein
MGKQRQRAVARTHQRTRELSPVLPQLVVRADTQKRNAQALLAAATAAGPGQVFQSEDVTLRRLPPARDGGRPDVIVAQAVDGRGPRINDTLLDDYAFWAWASIEVLRHTAMRVREMLELTHRSFVAYTLPGTSEVIPLLQVAPSKTDRERLLVVSPELSEALAAIIARVRGAMTTSHSCRATTAPTASTAPRCRSCVSDPVALGSRPSPRCSSNNSSTAS